MAMLLIFHACIPREELVPGVAGSHLDQEGNSRSGVIKDVGGKEEGWESCTRPADMVESLSHQC